MDSETSDLATRLRLETQELHLRAERSGYIQEILKRRASREGYALLLRNLEPAYRTMERALAAQADHVAFAGFSWPPLFRSAAIAADLEALAGAGWSATLPLLAEGRAYADRIGQATAASPAGAALIAHAYVRYIGDLSGGQIVQRLLGEAPGLTADMLTFYDFPGIADAEAYKEGFRDALERAGEVLGEVDGVVEEAKLAFRLNIDLSLAVGETLVPARES